MIVGGVSSKHITPSQKRTLMNTWCTSIRSLQSQNDWSRIDVKRHTVDLKIEDRASQFETVPKLLTEKSGGPFMTSLKGIYILKNLQFCELQSPQVFVTILISGPVPAGRQRLNLTFCSISEINERQNDFFGGCVIDWRPQILLLLYTIGKFMRERAASCRP
jgi:hypothetical protein